MSMNQVSLALQTSKRRVCTLLMLTFDVALLSTRCPFSTSFLLAEERSWDVGKQYAHAR